jgi:hypothetical protein
MPNITTRGKQDIKVTCKTKLTTSYRGFSSIDQEIEREIALQWFSSGEKSSFSQRNFLLKKDKA